ncbi:hypothetical protein HY639_03940 [Candidatus Woesearchaeota archaeon]|nr:hypothetical protein [Candidatus Woesearchaeota archaeon]
MLRLYDGIAKPDGRQELTSKSSITVVHKAFDLWYTFFRKTYRETVPSEGLLDTLLEEAIRLTCHLPMLTIDATDYFSPVETLCVNHRPYAGLFYTALLQTADRMVIGVEGLSYLGYRLARGTIELNAATDTGIGQYATGGCVVNNNTVRGNLGWGARGGLFVNNGHAPWDFGAHATGGLFVNNGASSYCADNVSGGIFVNHGQMDFFADTPKAGIFLNDGTVTQHFGSGAEGGFFGNGGDVSYMGSRAKVGLFLTTCQPRNGFMQHAICAGQLVYPELLADLFTAAKTNDAKAITGKMAMVSGDNR